MANSLAIPRPSIRLPQPAPYRILSLSGGGYRGLFTARLLSKLAAQATDNVGAKFDMFAGTSIGGLLAAGLAVGRSPDDLSEAIAYHGPKIFDDRIRIMGRGLLRKPAGFYGGLLGAKFQAGALEQAINDVLGSTGAKLKVKDVPLPLLLVATCVTSRSPFIMTNIARQLDEGSELDLVTALRATSAAPGYFPAVDLNTRSLVDGGLLANAPDMVAIATVLKEKRAALDQITMISIGTAAPNNSEAPSAVGKRGLLGWLRRDLVPMLLETQEKLSTSHANQLLGQRHWRLNALPSAKQQKVIDLDRATDEATRTLVMLADETAKQIDKSALDHWFRN